MAKSSDLNKKPLSTGDNRISAQQSNARSDSRTTKVQLSEDDRLRISYAVNLADRTGNSTTLHVQRLFSESINNGTLDLNQINEYFSNQLDGKVSAGTQNGELILVIDCDDEDNRRNVATLALARAKLLASQAGQSTITATNRDGRRLARDRDLQDDNYVGSDDQLDVAAGSALPAEKTSQTVNSVDVIGSSSDINGGIIPKKEKRAVLQISPQSSRPGIYITDFFITSIREEDSEKYQIVETFGTNYLFFYGRRPRIYTISGILINAKNKDWKNEFKENYNAILRGSQLARTRRKAVFSYEDVVREGYLLSFSHQVGAENPHSVPFSFSMFITRESKAAEEISE